MLCILLFLKPHVFSPSLITFDVVWFASSSKARRMDTGSWAEYLNGIGCLSFMVYGREHVARLRGLASFGGLAFLNSIARECLFVGVVMPTLFAR
jgi:hypothetical protein